MEKQLSFAQAFKQKIKGTWDSPCIEICSYKLGHPFCRACGMTRPEKKTWVKLDSEQKQEIRKVSAERVRVLPGGKSGTNKA